MIEVTLQGQIPQLEVNLQRGLDKVGRYMVRSVQKNFERGGRPAWAPVKSGETPLVASGKLYRSVKYMVGKNEVVILAGEGLPYARIHHFGGVTHPVITRKSRAFFWAMWFETKDVKWKYMALKQVGSTMNVKIPARPYMLIQPEDVEFIKDVFLGESITIIHPNGMVTKL